MSREFQVDLYKDRENWESFPYRLMEKEKSNGDTDKRMDTETRK